MSAQVFGLDIGRSFKSAGRPSILRQAQDSGRSSDINFRNNFLDCFKKLYGR
ncbi:MAG: hypothetical protein UU19_C0039G0006 [Candidatus Curtissbacteria bacterium GW2011_GWD1_40_8]|nr:MAG: hypothetical protein UU19_C0039G0006 [Candidatus Curtissbacteria bacterium GW2011_GWD1_40_8]